MLPVHRGAGASEEEQRERAVCWGSSDMETFGVKVDSVALQKDMAERTASFEKMLKQYFKTVGVVQGKDYAPDMSDNYDVTVFDGKLRELEPERLVRGEGG